MSHFLIFFLLSHNSTNTHPKGLTANRGRAARPQLRPGPNSRSGAPTVPPVHSTARRTVPAQLPGPSRRPPGGSVSPCQGWVAMQNKTQAFFFFYYFHSVFFFLSHCITQNFFLFIFFPLLTRGKGRSFVITWLEFTWDGNKYKEKEGREEE